MDLRTRQVLQKLGIEPDLTPDGVAKVLEWAEFAPMSDMARKWGLLNEDNRVAIAYEVETEHERHIGVVLRNLFLEKGRSSHLTVVSDEKIGPKWHNLTPALPIMWETGVGILVEGPKDARVLHTLGLPAVAYLGAAPSKKHLTCMKRYVHSVLWIPDVEFEKPEVAKRREQVVWAARNIGLGLQRVKIREKDPALLIGKTEEIRELWNTFNQVSILGGKGCATVKT